MCAGATPMIIVAQKCGSYVAETCEELGIESRMALVQQLVIRLHRRIIRVLFCFFKRREMWFSV